MQSYNCTYETRAKTAKFIIIVFEISKIFEKAQKYKKNYTERLKVPKTRHKKLHH